MGAEVASKPAAVGLDVVRPVRVGLAVSGWSAGGREGRGPGGGYSRPQAQPGEPRYRAEQHGLRAGCPYRLWPSWSSRPWAWTWCGRRSRGWAWGWAGRRAEARMTRPARVTAGPARATRVTVPCLGATRVGRAESRPAWRPDNKGNPLQTVAAAPPRQRHQAATFVAGRPAAHAVLLRARLECRVLPPASLGGPGR